MLSLLESFHSSSSTYCEAGLGFLGTQPINTISNIVILFSAYFAYRFIVKRSVQALSLKILPILLFLTGISSMLWHGYPNVFTEIADSISLFIFLVIAFYFLLDKLLGSKIFILLGTLLFIAVQIPFQVGLLPPLNGLVPYSIIFLAGLGIFYGLSRKYGKFSNEFLVILGVFAVALLFRTIDLPVCTSFSIGTHFLWQIFAALALYLTVRFLTKIDSYEGKTSKLEISERRS